MSNPLPLKIDKEALMVGAIRHYKLLEGHEEFKVYDFEETNKVIRLLVDLIEAQQASISRHSASKNEKITQQNKSTPSAGWLEAGEPDPHGATYDCERSKLAKGELSDDQLANGMFLCDHRTSLDSIVWLTAGKDRIRWLSRSLFRATQIANKAIAIAQKSNLNARSISEILKEYAPEMSSMTLEEAARLEAEVKALK